MVLKLASKIWCQSQTYKHIALYPHMYQNVCCNLHQKGLAFCRSICVKKVMKLVAFIIEHPSYRLGKPRSKINLKKHYILRLSNVSLYALLVISETFIVIQHCATYEHSPSNHEKEVCVSSCYTVLSATNLTSDSKVTSVIRDLRRNLHTTIMYCTKY